MCGIGGCVVAGGGEVDRPALERLLGALIHRGPDDQGVEVVDRVGLVHTRLAIVDPTPSGHAPMRTPDGSWWLTYNGEVFNHLEIRRQLGERPWVGGSDTETVLHALASGGESAIERFNGLFAFAALDRERGRLLLVRDRFGVKPLYWARSGDALWFASEIKGLLAAGVPRRLRSDALTDTLGVTGWVGGRAVPLEGIARVLPGTFLTVDVDTLEIRETPWYRPEQVVDRERSARLAKLPAEQIADAVEEAVRTSVRRRLMADVPIGTMCSGGVDSSLITAFARDEHPSIHAFNASVSDQPESDEGPWARRVADHLDVELHTVRMDRDAWCAGLVESVRHVEYPLTHESSVPMAAIAGLARSRGVKVLLSGEGADELFGGYGWLHQREYADFAARRRPAERLLRAAYRRWQDLRARPGAHPLAEPRAGATKEVHAHETALLERALDAYGFDRGLQRRLKALLVMDLGTYLPHLLNRQDKATMQQSVETRVPFLDPDVVSLALNLSVASRIEPVRKAPLAGLARRLLPPGVADRPKVGFGFDVSRYLSSAARPEFVQDGRLREALGVDRDTWSTSLRLVPPLRLWTAEIWCRLFLDGESTAAVEAALWRG